MKINRTITQQTLKELSKSISKMADLLGEEAAGIECKRIKVDRSIDDDGVLHVELNIKLSVIDGSLKEAADILERFK